MDYEKLPHPGQIAEEILTTMVAREPVAPIGWALVKDKDGRPLYTMAIVMGSGNAEQFARSMGKLQSHLKPVDIFEETTGDGG